MQPASALFLSALFLLLLAANAQTLLGVRTNRSAFQTTRTWEVTNTSIIQDAFRRTQPARVGQYAFFVVGYAVVRVDLSVKINETQPFPARTYVSLPSLTASLIDPTVRILLSPQ